MSRRPPWLAILLTIVLLAARILRVDPLTDPTGGTLPPGLHLSFPALHLALIPLFDLWDAVSLLSYDRILWFTGGLLLGYFAWRAVSGWRRHQRDPDPGPPIGLIRELGFLLLALALFVAFLAGGLLWHRPMAAVAGLPDDVMAVDLHSHTSASHDVEDGPHAGFDAEASRRWHRRAGFDAFFVTDHNTVAGLPPAGTGRPAVCPGIEISAWRAHIVLLGTRAQVPRAPYVDSLAGVLALLSESEQRYGALAIASLPEYDRNHWPNLDRMVAAGVDGFEIVNGSPKARSFSMAHRDSIVALARAHDLLLVAATDHHGWGATTPGWNLVTVPGWRASADPCAALMQVLARRGVGTVQIAERHALRDEAWWPSLLTPLAVVWEDWRSLEPPQTVAWLVWIWAVGVLLARRR